MTLNFEELQQHIQYLESIQESDAPTVNCYLGVAAPYRNSLNVQARSITEELPLALRASFWEILGRIEVFLGTGLQPGVQGLAIFARWGAGPFFLPLQFDVVFANRILLDPKPRIEPLVAVRDAMIGLAGTVYGAEAGRCGIH